MAVAVANNLCLSNLDNMKVTLNSNMHLSEQIENISRSYHTINVKTAMTNLGNVGKILKLAYAGSKGFKCSVQTIEMLSKYQSMIKNSYLTMASFVEACLSALKYHKLAIIMAEKGKPDSSFSMLSKCSDLANKMAAECEKLVKEAVILCGLAETALKIAHEDENTTQTQKAQIKKLIDENKAKQAEMTATIEQLAKHIQDAREKEIELSRKADQERSREFILKMTSTIMAPMRDTIKAIKAPLKNIGNVKVVHKNDTATEKPKQESAPSQEKVESKASGASGLEQQELEIIKLKNQLMKEEREANAGIAKTGELLKNLDGETNDLTASIASLELAIQALGKIKTTFEQTRQFWLGVETHCKKLGDSKMLESMKDFAQIEFQDEFLEEIRSSGISWLSLGRINHLALESIEQVDKKTDNILCNLPTKQQAIDFMKNDSDSIIALLKNEECAVAV